MRIALSFDDGPSALTPPLLDVLRDNKARATFFVLGDQIEGRERVLRRAAREGHELGVHGWDHSRHPSMDDLERTRDAVEDASGFRPVLFRPPYGDVDPDCPWEATLWDIDPEDWARPEPGELVARILAELSDLSDGCVVDLHDGRRAGPETVRAVATLLPMLKRRGYEAVTISELRRRTP